MQKPLLQQNTWMDGRLRGLHAVKKPHLQQETGEEVEGGHCNQQHFKAHLREVVQL